MGRLTSILWISCLLGAHGNEDGVQLLQFQDQQAPGVRSLRVRIPEEWRVICSNASVKEYEKYESLRAFVQGSQGSNESRAGANETQMPGGVMNPSQIQGMITVTLMGMQLCDKGLDEVIDVQKEVAPKLMKALDHCKDLAVALSPLPTESDSKTSKNPLSAQAFSDLKEIRSCLQNYAEYALGQWNIIFKAQGRTNAKLYEFGTIGNGKNVPGIRGFAEDAWSKEKTEEGQLRCRAPLEESISTLKQTASTHKAMIAQVSRVTSLIDHSTKGLREAITLFTEAQKKHQEYKFLEDMKKSPMGAFMPPQLTTALRTVTMKFHKSANLTRDVLDTTQNMTTALFSKGFEKVDVGAATGAHLGALIIAIAAAVAALRE